MSMIDFAAACADTNSVAELKAALRSPADPEDCATWGITDDEWRDAIRLALRAKRDGISVECANAYSYAADDEIEVRVNLSQSASPLEYRLLHLGDDGEWESTPFQRAEISWESDALKTVAEWLAGSTQQG